MSISNVSSRWRGGVLEWYDERTNEVVGVTAPMKKFDDFNGANVDTTNDWTFAAVNSGAIAAQAAAGGHARITTGVADNDDAELASGLMFSAAKGCVVEARFANNDASGLAWNFGFSDATGEAADKLAYTYATATLASNASDAALFFWDPDGTTDYIRYAATKADTDSTVYSTATADTDATFHTYRIELDTSGNATFWMDGEYLRKIATTITTATALTTYLAVINRESAANTMDVDYIRAWSLTR